MIRQMSLVLIAKGDAGMTFDSVALTLLATRKFSAAQIVRYGDAAFALAKKIWNGTLDVSFKPV